LRAAPTSEDEFCVLANYKSIRNREIVCIKMKGFSPKTIVDTARVTASLDQLSPSTKHDTATDESMLVSHSMSASTDSILESDELLIGLGSQYHAPALAAPCAQVPALAGL
jgi:hypothetical protein